MEGFNTVLRVRQGEFEVSIRAERDPKFYFFNFYLVIYLIVLTNICLVSIDPIDAGDRNAVSLTLLLTLVAFKFVLNEGTPKVGYLTLMDKYVVTSFLFILIATFENIFVSPLVMCAFSEGSDCDEDSLQELTEDAREKDILFQLIFAFIWSSVNVLVALGCFIPSLVRMSWKKVENDQIGQTEETLRRTKRITDGSKRMLKAVKTEEMDGVTFRVVLDDQPAVE